MFAYVRGAADGAAAAAAGAAAGAAGTAERPFALGFAPPPPPPPSRRGSLHRRLRDCRRLPHDPELVRDLPLCLLRVLVVVVRPSVRGDVLPPSRRRVRALRRRHQRFRLLVRALPRERVEEVLATVRAAVGGPVRRAGRGRGRGGRDRRRADARGGSVGAGRPGRRREGPGGRSAGRRRASPGRGHPRRQRRGPTASGHGARARRTLLDLTERAAASAIGSVPR